MCADMAEHLVEVPDPPRLSDDPGVQVEHHHPPCRRAVGVDPVEPLAPEQIGLVDRPPAMEMDVVVVEIGVDAERIELTGLWGHPVRLLVIAPVADIADAFIGEQVRRVRSLLKIGSRPAYRPRAGHPLDCLDRGADVSAFLGFGHAGMDQASARQSVRDEFGAAFRSFLDKDRGIAAGFRSTNPPARPSG
jgi:hypothetical protein